MLPSLRERLDFGRWTGLAGQSALLTGTMAIILVVVGGLSIVAFGIRVDRDASIRAQHAMACHSASVINSYLDEHRNILSLLGQQAATEPETLSPLMNSIRSSYPEFTALVAVDGSGQIIASSGDIGETSPALLKAQQLAADPSLDSPLQDFPVSQGLSMIITIPIVENHVITGAAAGEFSTQQLGEKLAALEAGEEGRIYFTNGEETIIGYSNPVVMLSRAQQPNNLNSEGGVYDDINGNPVVGASCAIGATGWVAVAEMPRAQAYYDASLWQSAVWVLYLVLTATMTALFGWWVAERFISPLRELRTGVLNVRHGNFEYRISSPRSDEIGDLAHAFNAMTIQLTQRTREVVELNHRLEDRVAARTTELVEANTRMEAIAEALYQMSKRANAANQAKSVFLANMSHELRTPLNSMIMYHDLILRGAYGKLTQKQQDRLQKSRDSARLLLELIGDVLDIAKIEAGELIVRHEETDIRPILKASRNYVEPLLKSDRVRFIMDVPEDLPAIIGDGQRVQQILLNLLSNAAKFTRAGTLTLTARRLCIESDTPLNGNMPPGLSKIPNGEWVAVSVSDTGIGIPENKLEEVFEEFKQVDDSSTREYRGTGLGLAICRRLVHAQHGYIGLASTPGKGSTFSFILPTTRQPE